MDEDRVPESINWNASDTSVERAQKAKAMMLSFWDGGEKTALRIDLWTKEMNVEEMKIFFHQTLLTMADTFEKATGEKNICDDMRDYCMHFAEKMKII